jgi:hypothetical protein
MSIQQKVTVLVLTCSLGIFGGRAAAQSPDLNKDAVAVWNFDEGSGTTLKDNSGNGHHGSIAGAKWIKGSWGWALRFDRDKGNYVNVPDSPGLHVQPPYTLGVWLRTTSSRNNAVYLIGSSNTHGYGLYFYGDSMSLYHDAKGADKKLYHKGSGARSLPDGTWHHVVGTCGDGKLRLFLDGRVLAERDMPKDLKLNYSGSPDLALGRWRGVGHLDGDMGKAYILKKALSKEEVKAVFEAERKKFNNDVTISRAPKAPVIDGRLDDACWINFVQNQTALDNFTLNNFESTPAKKQTWAYLCYDDKNLYIAARCQEPGMGGLKAVERPRDDERAGDDDSVEVFLAPRDGRYYQFVLTAANALLDLKCDYEIERTGYAPGGFSRFKADRSWDCSGIETAIHKGEKFWSVEMAIPLSQVGSRPADVAGWRLNIVRSEKQTNELSTFSPLFESLHQPEAFSTLTFGRSEAVLTRAKKKFVSIDVTPSAKTNYTADKGDKPIVFVNNYLDRGYYTTLPKEGQEAGTIEIFASLGEYEPATFSVRATGKAIEGVKAAVAGDLKNKDGAVIPSKNVDIRVVELWKRQIRTRQHMFMERYLHKQTAVDIPRHTTRRFWLTVHVPADATGGMYHSKILITSGKTTLKALNLKVEVLPFKLTSSEGMGYFMYLPYWGIPKGLRTQEYAKKIFVDMRKHGMTTATLYLFPWGKVDGKRQFTFEAPGEHGQFAFGPTMDALRDTGLLAPGIPAIWLGVDIVGPESWKKVLDEGKKRNWPELVFYLQDEPGDAERNANARRLFAMLDRFKKQNPQYSSIRSTTAIGSKGIEALGHLYDIWIAGAGIDEKTRQKAKQMGKLLWSYDCGMGQVDAETTRYYFGLWCWKTGLKGCSFWAYSDWANPAGILDWDYIEKHLENMELPYSFVYPLAAGPVPSVGWEAIREGIDDHKYISTLTKMIEKAKAAGHKEVAQRAAKTLKEITDKIRVKALGEATRAGRASGWRSGALFDRPSPQAEISKGDYDKFRYRIAGEIRKLHSRQSRVDGR